MSSRASLRVVALAVVLGGAGYAIYTSTQKAAIGATVMEACSAMDAGDYETAIATTEALLASPGAGGAWRPSATRCRALSLWKTGQQQQAAQLVLVEWRREGAAALEAPDVAQVACASLLEQERYTDVIELAQAASEVFPPQADIVLAELVSRSLVQSASEAAAVMGPKVASLDPTESVRHRMVLGQTLAAGGEVRAGMDALLPQPPASHPLSATWFEARLRLAGMTSDATAVRAVRDEWTKAGLPEQIASIYHAFTLNWYHLDDSTVPPLDDLLRAPPPETPQDLLRASHQRLIMDFANAGNYDEARRVWRAGLDLGLDLAFNADEMQALGQEDAPTEGVTTWELELGELAPGSKLLVSPPEDSAPDAAYEELAFSGTTAHLERPPARTPLRWILLGPDDTPIASGSAALRPGRTVHQQAETSSSIPIPPLPELLQGPGDGRRRVFVVIADCGDWRFYRYLQARGELPVLSALEARGLSGTLHSDPPFTGIAMQRIATPEAQRGLGLLGYLHRLGVELEGLESVTANPLAGLHWVLPAGSNLVDIVGAGDRTAVNLMFAHGDIEVGRNAQMVGPHGRTTQLDLQRMRPLDTIEQQLVALPEADDKVANNKALQGVATELDLVVERARSGDTDLLLMRVEQVDLATHGTYGSLISTSVDNGRGLLFGIYRYVDYRLGQIAASLDSDDLLVFMSDHGIQTSFEHSPHAVLVVAGGRVGRLEDRPAIDGIPRLLTTALGMEPASDWPDRGLEQAVLGEQ